MLDLGWTELLVIGVVALIVVGPKDLPVLFRKVGQFVGKAKGMAREFSSAMNQAAEDSGMKEATSSFKNMASAKDLGLDDLKASVDPLKDIDPDSETAKLAADRAKAAKAMAETAKRNTEERLAKEAAAKETAKKPAASKKAPAKTAAEKTGPAKAASTKKAPAKTAVAKTAAPKKAPAKKPAAKSTAAKTTAAKSKPAKAKPAASSKDTA